MKHSTTFTQHFSVEQPNDTNYHIEHPTTVTRKVTIIEQTTYIKMTSHLDKSRTVSFTPISTFKQ